eukprot:5008051-Amphidinium_carterae.1
MHCRLLRTAVQNDTAIEGYGNQTSRSTMSFAGPPKHFIRELCQCRLDDCFSTSVDPRRLDGS